jgi:hypothetical protein
MKNRVLGILLGLTLTATALHANDAPRPKGPEEDGTLPALVKIAGEGAMDSHAFEYLTELSDEVGARVTGSAAGQKAIDWGLAKMKAIGLQNVRAEKWSMWKGWTRGKAEAELLAPIHHPLTIDAMGWTGSTPAIGVEAEVVTANLFDLAADVLEAVKPDVLAQNATIMALAAFWVADRPERLASPWPAEKTAKMLREKGEYETLKAFGLWPFRELGA